MLILEKVELDGVFCLKNALSDVPLRSIILGRLENFYQHANEIKKNLSFPTEQKKPDLTKLLQKM